MPLHYTATSPQIMPRIRWLLILLGLIIPLVLAICAVMAWLDGAPWAKWAAFGTYAYLMLLVMIRKGPAIGLQAHLILSAVLCLAFYMGVFPTKDSPNEWLLATVICTASVFIVGAYRRLDEISCRVDRQEAPTGQRALEFPGIYRITCQASGKQYIGQTSLSIRERRTQHLDMLRANRHHNHWLQADWNLYRPEQFTFEVLEVVTDPVWLLDRERFWQDQDYDPARRYNPPNIPPRLATKPRPRQLRRARTRE